MSKHIANENLLQREAFETYYSLGDTRDRNLQKVSEKHHVSVQTVRSWRRNFSWETRTLQRDAEVSAQLSRSSVASVAVAKAAYIDIIDETIEQWKQNLTRGEIRLDTVDDLQKMVKLRLLLAGENTENVGIGPSGSWRVLAEQYGLSQEEILAEAHLIAAKPDEVDIIEEAVVVE
jgi:hypothetical protein